MSRWRAGLAAMVALTGVVGGGAAPVSSQEPAATGTVALVSQTTDRTAGQPFSASLRVRTSSATPGLEIAVGAYRRVSSRSEFVNSVEGRLPSRTPTDLERFPLDSLVPDADGNVTISFTPTAGQDGVYPLRIELRDRGGAVVDGFTTFVTTVPATIEADPIDVAVVLPLHAPASVAPDGKPSIDTARASALTDLATVLGARPSLPLTVVPTPETIDALSRSTKPADRDTMAALRTAVAGRQVPAATYVPTDLPSFLEDRLADEYALQANRGATVVEAALGVDADAATAVVDERLDDRALQLLARRGATTFVVPERHLEPIRLPNRITPTSTFGFTGSPGSTVAVADAGLAAHFERDVPPALAASYLLADLSVLWLDSPGKGATRRGVVVMPDPGWNPDASLVDDFLAGLTSNPVFHPVTAAGFADEVGRRPGRTTSLRSFLPREPGATDLEPTRVRTTRESMAGFVAVVGEANPAVADLERRLLVSESSEVRATRRRAYLAGIERSISDALDGIDMPDRRSITLTAREGELPVTITSALDYPATVVLTLDSETLDFPGGNSRTLELARQNTTERFTVHARGSGSFPVRVRVLAPSNGLVIEESLFTVRSTAVSGVGVGLSVGAALFLVVWWASHLRGRRRSRASATHPEGP